MSYGEGKGALTTWIIVGIVFVCLFLSVGATCIISIAQDTHSIAQGTTNSLSHLDLVLSHADEVVAKQAKAEDSQLAFIRDIQVKAKGLLGELNAGAKSGARSATHFESVSLPALDAGIKSLQKAIDANSKESIALIAAGTKTVESLSGPIQHADATLQTADSTIGALKGRIIELQPILEDVHGITTSGKATVETAQVAAKEGEQYFFALLNPKTRPFWEVTFIKIGETLLPVVARNALSRLFTERVKIQP